MMPVQMRDVYSSHVDSIGHDPDTQELVVKWNGGKTSVYSNVPAEKAQAAMSAWSVGKFVKSEIIPNHPHRYA